MVTDSARRRREAAAWLARLRAPDGDRDRGRFEQWRASSPENEAAFARVEQQWSRSALIADSPLARASPLRQPWWRTDIKPSAALFGGALATAFALATCSVWIGLPAPTPPSSQRVASVLGQLRESRLSDGSRVTLDSDSAVSVRFTRGERHISLERGRARFRVAHDISRPFVVVAGNTIVIARGTVFDVVSQADTVRVALIQGAVDVIARTPSTAGQRIALAAGKQVIVNNVTGRVSGARSVGAAALSWTSGMLTFERTSLDQVVEQANRYSPTKLVLADPALAKLRVTGAFRAAAPADLAASLRQAFGLQIEHRPDGSILLSPAPEFFRPQQGG